MAKYSITCPYCGVENFSDAQVCRNCGRRLPTVNQPVNINFQLAVNKRHIAAAAVILILCSLLIIGYLLKENKQNNYLDTQYRPFELVVTNRQGRQSAKAYLAYRITKRGRHHLAGQAIYLTKQQTSKATSGELAKWYKHQKNYPLVINEKRHQMRLQTASGPVTLKEFYGQEITRHQRIIGPSSAYYHYSLRILVQ